MISTAFSCLSDTRLSDNITERCAFPLIFEPSTRYRFSILFFSWNDRSRKRSAESTCTRAVITFMLRIRSAFSLISFRIFWSASFCRSPIRFSSSAFSFISLSTPETGSDGFFSIICIVFNCPSFSFIYCSAFCDVRASILLTPAATALSDTILKSPICPVACTCVPPHSSTDFPKLTTRTCSPYFSPNSDRAPILFASSTGICRFSSKTRLSLMRRLTRASMVDSSLSFIFWKWEKSKRR